MLVSMTESDKPIQISQPCTGEEEWLAVKEPLMSGWLTQGPKVAEFEQLFAKRHQVPHALAVSSCTTGLHLILAAMGVGQGDEVIVPAFTWVATANVVVYCGATPVLVDVDSQTYNIDPRQVRSKITKRTKAIIAVHLFGLPADMMLLKEAAGDIPIIEDAACAAGAEYMGQAVGSLGYAAAFSFHPRKSVTTGEGGMVTTKDGELAARLNMLRNHGASISEEQRHRGPRPYLLPEFNLLGYNYRMTDLQGAVGVVQFKKLDDFIDERRSWAKVYQRELAEISWLRLPGEPSICRHGWQSFVCHVDPKSAPHERNEIMERLQRKGIATRPGTHAVHMLGYYREKFGYKPQDCSQAWECDSQSMAIPLHNRMSEDDYQRVIDAIREIGK